MLQLPDPSREPEGGVSRASAKMRSGERWLLNQGLRSGSPTGSRVVATRSFGSRDRPGRGEAAGFVSAEPSPRQPERARPARPMRARREKRSNKGAGGWGGELGGEVY